jgi:hypothetical protein
MALFEVPARLVKILDRDLKLAGIPKRDERGRTLDVHALRHTFGTLLSKGGVAPRTAQAAMRHSDIKLTMNVYTDPKLLDVAGALNALPALPLDGEQADGEALQATGTAGGSTRTLAPLLAPTPDKRSESLSIGDNMSREACSGTLAVSGVLDKRKDSLTTPVSESSCRGEPLCTFVDEIIGLPLALSLFPQVFDFEGEAVLSLVERGLYRKGFRVGCNTDNKAKG